MLENFFNYLIGTFDAQNLLLNSTTLSVSFLRNTTAKGVLLLFHAPLLPPLLITLSLKDSQHYYVSEKVSGRTIYIYDIKHTGYVKEGIIYAAVDPVKVDGSINTHKGK